MRNQIRAVVTANAIRLKRTLYSAFAFIVVEGDDDKIFFTRHTNLRTCRIQVAYGKHHVLGALEILEKDGVGGILGFVDADYSILIGDSVPCKNVVITNMHDIECILLSSPSLHHLLDEYGNVDRIESYQAKYSMNVLTRLLESGDVIGLVRLASHHQEWALNFDELDFTKFIDSHTLDINRDKFVEELRNHQGGRIGPPPMASDILNAIGLYDKLDHNKWDVCCGHDLVKILSIGLQRAWGNCLKKDVLPEHLEAMLRLAYENEYFRNTVLYRSTQEWETAHPPFHIL